MAYTLVSLILIALFGLFGVRFAFAGNPPTPISPSNNSTVSSSKLEWQTPSYQLYSSNPYRVQVDDDQTFTSLNKDYYTDNNFYTPSLSSRTWYWRVKAKDVAGTWSDWSSAWSFILTEAVPSPSPFPSPSSSISSSFIISNVPAQIDSTEEFSVSVNLSLPKSPNTTLYLKGAFKKADSSNYFGLTKVSGSWIKNNKTYSDQYKITTDSSSQWSGNLGIQPDILDSGYEGSGDYIFKVGRYTDSGSLAWSNEVYIKINAQEVVIEDEKEKEVLGVKESGGKSGKQKFSNDEELSLERYIKVATPAAKGPSSTPSAQIKGERRINFLSILGTIIVIIVVIPIVYAIYNKFRKRN